MIFSGLNNEDRAELKRIYEERRSRHNTLFQYSQIDIKSEDLHFDTLLETVIEFLQERPGWKYKGHMKQKSDDKVLEVHLSLKLAKHSSR